MPTNEISDPAGHDADQRAERAKASLLSRVEQLKHKLTDAKHKLDLHAQIVKHPLPAVGIAFALGAVFGLRRTGSVTRAGSGRSLRSGATAALAAFGLHVVREVALGKLGQIAKQWWSEAGAGSPAEVGGPRAADLEPFLEH